MKVKTCEKGYILKDGHVTNVTLLGGKIREERVKLEKRCVFNCCVVSKRIRLPYRGTFGLVLFRGVILISALHHWRGF